MAPPSETPDRADDITRLIAQRLPELRRAAGLNQRQLGDEMAKLRKGWSRSAVVKLEGYKRESISIGDLLALAKVLDVPPVLLVADPRKPESVPVSEDEELGAWTALMWMTGKRNLSPRASAGWRDAEELLTLLDTALAMIDNLEEEPSFRLGSAAEIAADRQVRDANDPNYLYVLGNTLQRLREVGAAPLPLSDRVLRRAKELNVELPGVTD